MPNTREKLMRLLCTANSKATEAEAFENATYAEQLGIQADYLIANGVTFAKDNNVPDNKEPKPQTDLRGKCGGCAYGMVAENVYGGSKCFIKCLNPDRIASGRRKTFIFRRTLKACRFYKERVG